MKQFPWNSKNYLNLTKKINVIFLSKNFLFSCSSHQVESETAHVVQFNRLGAKSSCKLSPFNPQANYDQAILYKSGKTKYNNQPKATTERNAS